MDFDQIALFNLADKRLAWVDQRQSVLAQNIANADTPGWQSRDLPPFAAALGQAGVALARTDPGHIAAPGGTPFATVAAGSGPTAPDGNGVSMDVELARIADTETTHDLVENFYTKYLGMFRTALDR